MKKDEQWNPQEILIEAAENVPNSVGKIGGWPSAFSTKKGKITAMETPDEYNFKAGFYLLTQKEAERYNKNAIKKAQERNDEEFPW